MDYNGRRLRHEQKYYISYGEYYNLVSKLSAVLKRDGNYGDKGYFIRSLYFDDMYNSSYYEKEAGNFTRSKYRIRIYNYSDKYGDIKLEQKCKIDRYIAKSSLVISKDQFYDIIDGGGEFLLDNRKKVAKDFYIATRYRLLRPSVIVDYYRDAFTMEEGNVRITFDMALQSGLAGIGFLDPKAVFVPAIEPGRMVLEVKYDAFLPSFIADALQIGHIRTGAFSKYAVCRKFE